MVSPQNPGTERAPKSAPGTYPARLLRPLLMHALHGNHPNRTAPGGSIVDVTENRNYEPGELTLTATVTIDGVLYARDLAPSGIQVERLP